MKPFDRMLVASVSGLVLALSATCSGGSGDPELWLSDFAELEKELAAGYANLEWAARHNDLDLAALSGETQGKLSRTTSRNKARKIIVEFLEAFNDPHLKAERSDLPQVSPAGGGKWVGPAATASSREALKAFGYRKSNYDFGVDFEALDGFRSFEGGGNPFPAGVLTLDDARKLGVIRIEYFGEDRYYTVATRTWDEFKSQVEGTCDEGCWWLYTLRVRSHLMEQLAARIREMKGEGVDALLVDITGNGGGSEWCEDVARLFTARPLLAAGTRFVKHEHWARQIEREIEWLEDDLAKDNLPDPIRAMLEQSRAAHEELLVVVRAGCDGSPVWQGRAPACDRLASDEHGRYEVPAGSEKTAATLSSAPILFQPIRHPEFVGLYDGPLFVTLDDGTASASEQFASLLRSAPAATLVGRTSYGAGCGYTRGGIKLYLRNVQLRVWMPDCMRLRADGENELAGIEPDVMGWDAGDRGKARARKLADALLALEGW